MKRWVAILFLTFFTVNFAGIYLYFTVQLAAIRQEMRAALRDAPDEQLVHLALSIDEYQKALHDEMELNIKGRFYDISRVRLEGGTVHVYCLFDDAESDLIGFIGDLFNQRKTSSHPLPTSIAQFVLLTYTLPHNDFLLPARSLSHPEDALLVLKYTCNLDNESPPPKG